MVVHIFSKGMNAFFGGVGGLEQLSSFLEDSLLQSRNRTFQLPTARRLRD